MHDEAKHMMQQQAYQDSYNRQQDMQEYNKRHTRQTAMLSATEILKQQMQEKERAKVMERQAHNSEKDVFVKQAQEVR